MKSDSNAAFLKEAIRIGNEILDKARRSEHGMYWETMSTIGGDVIWQSAEGIYSGVSGIVLLYLELHKQTGDSKYLNAVNEGSKWVINYCEQNSTDYYAFFTGRLGSCYTLIQVSNYTDDKYYLQKAIEFALESEKFLDKPEPIDDLINGISGSILGLMHLYTTTKDERLIPIIKNFTKRLIDRANLGDVGLYWDRSHRNIRGLCGYSHGACGIGYVFLELGRFFDNPSFYWIAEQAFAYENHYYNPDLNNWPDFRKGYFDEKTFLEHKQEYTDGNTSFFHKTGNMFAWCHGAPGIGLARLRASELLDNPQYKTDLENCLNSTKTLEVDPETLVGSAVVCHGHAGNAMLFTEAYLQTGNNKYFDYSRQTGLKLLDSYQTNNSYISGYSMAGKQEDISMFMGNAGVAYFYLSLLDPQNTPSIIKPDVKEHVYHGSDDSMQKFDIGSIARAIASKYYIGTIDMAVNIDFSNVSNANPLKHELFSAIDEFVSGTSNDHLKAIHAYEKDMNDLLDKMKSDSYISTKRIVDLESNKIWVENMVDSEIFHLDLQLEELSTLHQSTRDFINSSNGAEDEYYYLLSLYASGVKSFELSEFSYDVLNLFEQKSTTKEAIENIKTMYEVDTAEEEEQVITNVMLQVKEALKSGVLVRSTEAH